MKLRFTCAALITGAFTLLHAQTTAPGPVLVELFTSEGCSDCPPADKLLAKLGSPQTIVLSEHVDYWNRIGWTDPFSSPLFSQRQREYGDRFHVESIYTPQMVVDGAVQFVGSDSGRARQAIAEAAKLPKTAVSVSVAGRTAHLRVGEHSDAVQVFLAIAQDKASSDVKAGENRGRKLNHVAVVRSLSLVGDLGGGETMEKDFEIPQTAFQTGSSMHAVIFIQDRQTGRILGSALSPISAAIS